MRFSPKDRVVLSASPSIKTQDYQGIKPFASVSREADENGNVDLADMRAKLRYALLQAAAAEVDAYITITNAIAMGGVPALLEVLHTEIDNADTQIRTESAAETADPCMPRTAAAVGPGTKARRPGSQARRRK
jgi:hypothetical protein